jgi:hypothetical protein
LHVQKSQFSSIAGAPELLAALNAFRNYVTPKEVIKTGKHFNMPLLIEAFKLYDRNHDAFGNYNSHKNNLCWQKLIGYMQRFLPACYAQAFAQSIYIDKEGEKLRRSFDFCFGGGRFFPIDEDPTCRLGYNCAARDGYGGWRTTTGSAAYMEAARLRKLCQTKTAAMQRLIQGPCNQSKSRCLVM